MSAPLIWALAFLPFLNAIPTTGATLTKRACTNLLQNPSFEAGIDPWLGYAQGSWRTREVLRTPQGGHNGPNTAFYYAESNAMVAGSIMSVSQSELYISSGTTVVCEAWVATRRPGNIGSTSISVYVDDQVCGGEVKLANSGWTKVGGKVKVNGDSHSFVVVVSTDTTGPEGSMTWVDDALMGVGC